MSALFFVTETVISGGNNGPIGFAGSVESTLRGSHDISFFRSQADEQNIKIKRGITGVIDVQSLAYFGQNRVTRIKEKFITLSARGFMGNGAIWWIKFGVCGRNPGVCRWDL